MKICLLNNFYIIVDKALKKTGFLYISTNSVKRHLLFHIDVLNTKRTKIYFVKKINCLIYKNVPQPIITQFKNNH